MNAGIVETVGILKLKMYHMEFTKMFRHPKYYKELRKRNKSDQAISDEVSTEATSVRPGPGLKQQAPSFKRQAPEASSDKHQAPSSKRQA